MLKVGWLTIHPFNLPRLMAGIRQQTLSLLLSLLGPLVLPPSASKLSETSPSLSSVLSLPRLARSSSASLDLFVCTSAVRLESFSNQESTDQVFATVFESVRLVMVQRLLSSAEFKMDPLVSLYYFAPACFVMNGVATLFFEIPRMTMHDIYSVGVWNLVANASVAFALNVAVVFLVSSSPPFVWLVAKQLSDRKNIRSRPHSLRRPQRYPSRRCIHGYFPRPRHPPPRSRIRYCSHGSGLLQAWCRGRPQLPLQHPPVSPRSRHPSLGPHHCHLSRGVPRILAIQPKGFCLFPCPSQWH